MACILVIDDHPMNLDLAEYVLLRAGHEVMTADCAESGWTRIAERQPDLILMDIQMPGMDGLEMTRRLKADEAMGGIKVVALTAHAMKGDEQRMKEAGCDGYLTKPINVKTFAEQVGQWLPPP